VERALHALENLLARARFPCPRMQRPPGLPGLATTSEVSSCVQSALVKFNNILELLHLERPSRPKEFPWTTRHRFE